MKVAQTEQKLGSTEREFIASTASSTLLPIRRFLEGDMKTIQKERKLLQSKRLDLDACKSRLKKAKTLDAQANVSSVDVVLNRSVSNLNEFYSRRRRPLLG